MQALDQLERRFGRYAIHGLIRYVVALNVLTYLLLVANPSYELVLQLDREAILRGEIWRLVSWIFIPPHTNVLFLFFMLSLTWTFGEMLESFWGAFRLNVFYGTGIVGCIAGAFIVGEGGAAFATYLSLSILFAAATLNPDFRLLLFFVIPAPLKWIALFSLVLVTVGLAAGAWSTRLAIVTSLANYLLFFGPQFARNVLQRRRLAARRTKFRIAKGRDDTIHRCSVCDRTEASNPDLDFRVSSDGKEYCLEHLPSRKTAGV